MRNKSKEYGALAVMIIVFLFFIGFSYLSESIDEQHPENKTVIMQTKGKIESVSQTIKPGLFSDVIIQTIMVDGNTYTLNGYETIFKKNQFVTFSYIEGNNNIQKIVIE